MKKTLLAIALTLVTVTAFAKDKQKDYQIGTLAKVPLHVGGKVTTGFTDTTSCDSGLLGVHCTGGIVDDYSGWLVADMPDGTELVLKQCVGGASLAAAMLSCDQPFTLALTEEDGTVVFLDHTWGHHDSAKNLETTSKILYRTERHGGVTYVMIPDPDNPKKEGSYNPIKLPRRTAKNATPQAADNVKAMCASGKLSADQQKQFCPTPTK
jgi:hypothetical protein